jgi:hypothetical protein
MLVLDQSVISRRNMGVQNIEIVDLHTQEMTNDDEATSR